MSLDKIYYRQREKDFFLDCTRLDKSKDLVSRKDPNDLESVDKQIKEISEKLKQAGNGEVVLVDDVVFSGNVLRSIISKFESNGIKVIGIRSAISTEESYESFNKTLEKGLKCGIILGKDVIDQICERDFYFGIAQSGISVKGENGRIYKAPYFKPFGNPVERASIPKMYEDVFSNNCLMRSMYLWKKIEDRSLRPIKVKELPEEINDLDENERVINVLRKGLINYEKGRNERNEEITNRDNGECR